MKILFVGDVFGRPGRKALKNHLPQLKIDTKANWCIVNAENAAAGKGLTSKISRELIQAGADILTTGNHVWDQKEYRNEIQDDPRVIRPSNFPPGNPGKGWIRLEKKGVDCPITVIQIQGRIFMNPLDCPFQTMDRFLKNQNGEDRGAVIVDFHAEATSEKQAMGWYLNGRVAALIGTHTHVQTADEIILPRGTAYITDVGMTGPHASIIGCDVNTILHKFLYSQPVQHEVASGDVRISAVLITLNPQTRKALSIERIVIPVDDDKD